MKLARLVLHVVDDRLHAVGGVDQQHEIDADLAEAAEQVAEAAAARPAAAREPRAAERERNVEVAGLRADRRPDPDARHVGRAHVGDRRAAPLGPATEPAVRGCVITGRSSPGDVA